MDRPISEAFFLLASLAATKFPTPMTTFMEYAIDENWRVQFNAARESVDGLQPFSARVFWCDWPAGVIDAGGGVIAAGSAANENSLIEALKAALAEAEAPRG